MATVINTADGLPVSKDNPLHVTMVGGESGGEVSEAEFKAHAENVANPHKTTKAQVGLSKVADVLQASKAEFDAFKTAMQAEIDALKTTQTSILARLTALENPPGP